MKSIQHPADEAASDGRVLASLFSKKTTALDGERSWAYAMRRIGRALEANGYHVTRAHDDHLRDDLESSLLTLCGQVGRVIAEHHGAKLTGIDIFEHVHTPGRVWIVTELSCGHLHGVTIPLLHPSPRAPVIEDAGPVLVLEGVTT